MRRMRRRDGFEDVFDQMQRMFQEIQERGQELGFGTTVPVDIQEEDGKIVVKADLPGVTKEDINLKADSEKLEIAAGSTQELREENEKYLRQERSSRSFRRTVSWPSAIDPETIHAEYSDGVLTVEAEKTGEEGRDIEIE